MDTLTSAIMNFTLSLYDMPSLPRNSVQEIIDKVDFLISNSLVPYLEEKLLSKLKNEPNKLRMQQFFSAVLHDNKHIFRDFQSEYSRLKMYKQYSCYVPPENIVVGDEKIFQIENYSEISIIKKPIHLTYIPVQPALEKVLSTPGLLNDIQNYLIELENDNYHIANFMQAKLWQDVQCNPQNKNKNILPVALTYDDFEPGNALGSHSGQQKLGGVYLQLLFMPQNRLAQLCKILVTGIFYSKHRKLLGNQIMFNKIIDEMNKLYTDGITINYQGVSIKIYFKCMLLLGDNLGINSMTGFVESFTATRYCRICTATSTECKHMIEIKESQLRTTTNYFKDLSKNCISTGIKERCAFNNLFDFHVVKNTSVDIMHDLFEGVFVYSLAKILTGLIYIDKLFSLETLNARINNFDYGVHSVDKPCPLIKDTQKNNQDKIQSKIKIKQSAAEMICLCRYLGLIIGDLVPNDNKYWEVYKIIRQITGIVTSPVYVSVDLTNLNRLVRLHNEKYISLFGLLKPKMHFMLHLPKIMLRNGPAIHLWSMPLERQNKQLKDIVVSSSSHRNLPLTIAIKIQLQQCFSHVNLSLLSKYAYGKIDPESSSHIYADSQCTSSIKFYKSLTIYNKMYTPGSIIVIGVADDGPIFGKIIKIFSSHDKPFFFINKIYNIYFNFHYHAYKVIISDTETEKIDAENLHKIGPCLLVQKGKDNYIATKYDI